VKLFLELTGFGVLDIMTTGGDYDVVTEVWSDDILQMAGLAEDSDDSSNDDNCFVDEFVADVDGVVLKLCIENHHKSTRDLVGLQVWRAGLYLSDYMLENVKNFKDKTVLELAAGTGLLSLVTSSDQIRAKQVICTDIDRGDILPQIRRNISLNKSKVTVAELDFTKELPLDVIKDVDVILAADVIYDAVITQAFFRCLGDVALHCLSFKGRIEAYVAMEARSRGIEGLDTLKIMRDELGRFRERTDMRHILNVEYIQKGSFAQKFGYNSANADMHMWKLAFDASDCNSHKDGAF